MPPYIDTISGMFSVNMMKMPGSAPTKPPKGDKNLTKVTALGYTSNRGAKDEPSNSTQKKKTFK